MFKKIMSEIFNIFIKSLDTPIELEIKKFEGVQEKYIMGISNKERGFEAINEIVIHGTGKGVTNIPDLNKWMMNPGEHKEDRYNKGIGLFHYAIDKDGSIWSVIDDRFWTYHSSSGAHDKRTIGIELMNGVQYNQGKYTKAQYRSLEELILNLMSKYPIVNITSHKYNKVVYSKDNSYYECPGNFNWKAIDTILNNNDYTFKKDGNLRYNISTS